MERTARVTSTARRKATAFRCLPLFFFSIAATLNAAEPSDFRLNDYVHTVWTQHDGSPVGEVLSLSQSTDGYLWITTREEGLLRFDGMRFVRQPTPCTRAAFAEPSTAGGLWIVCGGSLFRRSDRGTFRDLSAVYQRPGYGASRAAARDGGIWLLGDSIVHLDADGIAGTAVPRPTESTITEGIPDFEGRLWVTDRKQIVLLKEDRNEAFPVEAAQCLTPARAGGILAANTDRLWHLQSGQAARVVAVSPPGVSFSIQRNCMLDVGDGSLWISTRSHGVVLVRDGRVELLPGSGEHDRLSNRLLLDREGTIWAGSSSGLHRFRKPQTRVIAAASAFSSAPAFVFVDADDSVWLGPTERGTATRIANGTPVQIEGRIDAIAQDRTGRIWVARNEGIGFIDRGRFVAVPDATGQSIINVYSLAVDERGQVWALSDEVGLYLVSPGPARLVFAAATAQNRFLVSRRHGALVARGGGGLTQHVDGHTEELLPADARPEGDLIRTIVEDGDSVWVGALSGLRRWRNGKWTHWTQAHGLPARGGVDEIAADAMGRLWLMTRGGIIVISRPTLDATPDGAPGALSFARIGTLDGVVPHPGTMQPSPRLSRDSRGRLYFLTLDSLVVVDPAHFRDAALAPPIVLESVTVDNRAIDHSTTSKFVQPSLLQFDYGSLSLAAPENARYRYRLEGVDTEWKDAGSRRSVTYGAVAPGAYRFRVTGAGAEGVWNHEGASFAFTVVPVFWRTWWFRSTAALLGLLVGVGVHQIRVRRLTRQFQIRLEARLGERTRIARELHDTLLQSFQGVLIHVQAATNMLATRPDAAKQKFEQALHQGELAIREGREAVQSLRGVPRASADLVPSLTTLIDELRADAATSLPIQLDVKGRQRTLRLELKQDVYRIVAEAVRNALRHAEARRVQIEVLYDDRWLRVRVRDDGKGIDPVVLETRAADGRWGLPGMRERAELNGGTLEVRSRCGFGTEIDLSVPAVRAYLAPQSTASARQPSNTIVQ